jgi:hypothetical protein
LMGRCYCWGLSIPVRRRSTTLLACRFRPTVAEPPSRRGAWQVNTLVRGTEMRRERVANLSRLLPQLKQDMMNRSVHALTLVTFLATPVTLLTGTFGMNFADMYELVRGPAETPLPAAPFACCLAPGARDQHACHASAACSLRPCTTTGLHGIEKRTKAPCTLLQSE